MERDLIQDFITLAFYVMTSFSLMGFSSVSGEGLHACSSKIVILCHDLLHMIWEKYSCLLPALLITTWCGERELQHVEITISRHKILISDICKDQIYVIALISIFIYVIKFFKLSCSLFALILQASWLLYPNNRFIVFLGVCPSYCYLYFSLYTS
jgi:hypothetical protein